MNIENLLQRLDLGEDQDVEFKLAEGGLPKSLWETLSAFANTEGGTVVLGVSEKGDKPEIVGLRSPAKLIKAFWDGHNNPQKFSPAISTEADVQGLSVDGRELLLIRVRRAARAQRPVFINGNPLTGTYKRNFEGDYHCTEAEVRQMLRDASDEPQDGTVLEGFGLEDLDTDSLKAYRNRFASHEPDHPFLALDDRALLERLGGWRRDRLSRRAGLTLAGLLMFGAERGLLDALAHYHVDYQEHLSDDPEQRWTHRVTIDGKWAPNLFNFYYRVYPRLVNGLDVPFKLDPQATRIAETHVHEALREALVNTLIHADHQSSRPITVIKRQDAFVFFNPGRLRIPREALYQGGVSDPRNPNVQKMFQMLGLGEKAGSGFQKILRAWREQHWMIPLVVENPALEMTRVWLPLASMIPSDVEQELRAIVGDAYRGLDELGRVILMLAHRFDEIGNADIQPYRAEHPREIGVRLKQFVEAGWLEKDGHGRGTHYHWPKRRRGDLFGGSADVTLSSQHKDLGSQHSVESSQHKPAQPQHSETLRTLAEPVRASQRTSPEAMRRAILDLCAAQPLSLAELADLLGRAPASLQNHYLTPMLKEGVLQLLYPRHPNHPQQRYRVD
jgi:ATP-dependent DNA helicase RecG